MFWHTARDETMFTAMRCISKHEDTQVYGTILPKDLTNQAMLESKAYKTYYAFASGEKAPKPKYVRKKANSDTSLKKNPVQATKGTRLKTKVKVTKSDKKKQPAKKPKAKGLVVLSEVALTEAKQLKLATKRSKTQFHNSHANGSGDGVDTQSKVPDEQQQKTSDSNEEDDDDVDDSRDEDDDGDNDDDDDNDGNDDDEANSKRTESNRDEIPDPNLTNVEQTEQEEEEYIDQRVYTPPEYQLTEEEKNVEEKMDDEEEDEVTKELYKDVNINLGFEDAKMTDADQGGAEQQNVSQESRFEQVVKDAHVNITTVYDKQKTDDTLKSSSVSSDFTSKLLNLDNTPPRLDETSKATLTLTPTTSKATTSTLALPDFASIFKFNERVANLERNLSEMKQVDQYSKTLSFILAIVDRYMVNKLGEAINKAIQVHNFDCREEDQAEKKEYIELVDSTVRAVIKKEVNTQLPQILPQAISDVATPVIEKTVTESLEAAILTRSLS
ncbi:hypothetical protein Tco_1445224 [Tanacetum coccineum]